MPEEDQRHMIITVEKTKLIRASPKKPVILLIRGPPFHLSRHNVPLKGHSVFLQQAIALNPVGVGEIVVVCDLTVFWMVRMVVE